MLTLKGSQGKSHVIDLLRRNLLSDIDYICFEYVDDKPVIDGSTYVISSEYTLMEFAECINEFISERQSSYEEYIIIYTNKFEDEIQDVIQWLKNKSYSDKILLTCK